MKLGSKKNNEHEKIKTLQKKLSDAYPDAIPSDATEIWWIYATRKKGDYPKATSNSGKWLVFVNKKEVDKAWEGIKKATEDGLLGDCSKVATAKSNRVRFESPDVKVAIDPDVKVICVYTYDWTDEKDVKRIREELRKLGIAKKIPYKADEDTLAKKYQTTGHKKISKYYE